MLINRLLIACGRRHFEAIDRDWKLLNADVTPMHPVDLKPVEPVQKHVNKCEQRIIPELNGIILLKLCHESISLSQKEPDKRKMIQNGSDINTQEEL